MHGLSILIFEAILIYLLILWVHSLRWRIGLSPFYALLGGMTALMSWITDAGVQVEFGGIVFMVGSAVFYSSLLLGVFVLYVFDGPRAARTAIATVAGVSVLVPLVTFVLYAQGLSNVSMPSLRINTASVAATVADLLFLALAWEFLGKPLLKLNLWARAFLTLLGVMWLDVILFATGAFAGTPEYFNVMKGTFLSRLIISVFASFFLYFYLIRQRGKEGEKIQNRPVLSILQEVEEVRGELRLAQEEIQRRKTAEKALIESEMRFQTMVENLTEAVFSLRPNGTVEYVSPAIEEILGYSPEELVGQVYTDFFHSEDVTRAEATFAEVLEGKRTNQEYRMLTRDGEIRQVRVSTPLAQRAPEGSVLVQGVLADVTMYKQAAEALKASEERFRDIVVNTSDWIWEVDAQGVYSYCSEKSESLLGYTPQELIGKTPFDMMPPEQMEASKIFFADVMKEPRPFRDHENWNLRKDGQRVCVSTSGTPIFSEEGTFLGYRGTDTDITESKQAAQALRESQARLSVATQAAGIGVWDRDIVNDVLVWDDRMFELYGVDRDDFGGAYEAWQQGVHPDDRERAVAEVAAAERGEKPFDTEFRIVRSNGDVRWVKAFAQVLRNDDGNPLRMIGVNYDITERKISEQQVQGALDQIREISDRVPGVVYQFRLRSDGTSCFPYASEKIREIYRVTPEQVREDGSDVFAILHPDDYAGIVASIQKSADELSLWRHEYRVKFPDGTVRWLLGESSPRRDSDGSTLWNGFITDITERKQTEEALEESEAYYRLLFESSIDAVFVADAQTGKILDANQQAERLMGRSRSELLKMNQTDLHPDAERYRKIFEEHIREGADSPAMRLSEVVHSDGTLIPVEINAGMVELGRRTVVIGSFHDLRGRQEQEKALQASEEQFRSAIDDLLVGVVVHDADSHVLLSNPQAQKLLGLSAEQMMGKVASDSVWHFVCEDMTRVELEDYPVNRVLSTGANVVDKILGIKRSGSDEIKWVAVSAVPVFNGKNRVDRVVVNFMDITERKRAEERIHDLVQHLETIREEERKRLSRELHDDIGQILTALKIDLMMVEDECTCGPSVEDRMGDMKNLLSEGIQSVHSLCRQLRPGSLDDLTLEDALTGLVEDWKKRNEVECALVADVDDEALSDDVRTAVFRMVQEALTNVSRYAEAARVDVSLVADEKVLNVSVADDGKGMEPGAADKATSFGLLGMRERIEGLGGELSIDSSLGKGTRIEASIPLGTDGE